MEQRTLSQLDALDRAILAAVASARAKTRPTDNRRHCYGPTWSQVRAEVGLPPPPTLPPDAWELARKAIPLGVEHRRRLMWDAVEAQRPPDPCPEFRTRMERLRDDGFLTFNARARSLNVGERLREMYRQAKKAKPR